MLPTTPVLFFPIHLLKNFIYLDIDECTSPARIHECEDLCFNLYGSYKCGCQTGKSMPCFDDVMDKATLMYSHRKL